MVRLHCNVMAEPYSWMVTSSLALILGSFCAAEGAGSRAAVSSSREKAAGSGPERDILLVGAGGEREAAPSPSFSADLLPQRRRRRRLSRDFGPRRGRGRRGHVGGGQRGRAAPPPRAPSCAGVGDGGAGCQPPSAAVLGLK